ncbi:MAG: DUF1294 domain-containing protein [Anaerococcus sp.]
MKNLNLYIIILILNLITFIFYGIDKSRARRKKWRIKEIFLITMGLLGGSLGGLIGMKFFHHKTRKLYFYFFNILGLILLFYFLYNIV